MKFSIPCITPDWPAPPWVQALCTTRHGGVSQPPYDSLNLGDHVKDNPLSVAENRRIVQAATQAQWHFLQQVHGIDVVRVDSQVSNQTVGDAAYTQVAGQACTMMVADCLPVLITHTQQKIVGAAHAGWRGLAQGVVMRLLEQMQAATGQQDGWLVWLGPCIGSLAFEVGAEVRQAFIEQMPQAHTMFTPAPSSGKWLCNLAGLARLQLAQTGVDAVYGNDGSTPWCTYTQNEVFFSYRRQAVTGRIAAAVWLAE